MQPPYSSRLRVSLAIARGIAATRGDEYLGTQHLLLAMLTDPDSEVARILARHGFDASSAPSHIDAVVVRHAH